MSTRTSTEMPRDSRAFALLERAHDRLLSVGELKDAEKIAVLYRDLSGGCRPASHVWPISGPWCYCGREKWQQPPDHARRRRI